MPIDTGYSINYLIYFNLIRDPELTVKPNRATGYRLGVALYILSTPKYYQPLPSSEAIGRGVMGLLSTHLEFHPQSTSMGCSHKPQSMSHFTLLPARKELVFESG